MEGLLTKKELTELLDKDLIIRPLLDEDQIGEIGIDFRLGCNFLVSIQGREPVINASLNSGNSERSIKNFFKETRRQIGETFILHPNQTILSSSLEYVKLPNNCLLALYMRSSYSRLGLTVSTIVQPGYCGCVPIELTNNNNNPINLTVGSRIFQGVFFAASGKTDYFKTPRKYMCNVRPEPSAVYKDMDLKLLHELWKFSNNRD